MIDYYGEYHQGQQEEATPNLCPECNGDGWYYYPQGHWKRTLPRDTCSDCPSCHGTGTIDRPYTERDLWIDEVCHDTYIMLKEAGFDA